LYVKETTVYANVSLTFNQFLEIFNDCMSRLIHDLVATTYADEKKLRIQSAAVITETTALQSNGIVTPSSANPTPSKQFNQNQTLPQGTFSNATATWDNGKITLLEVNPLRTLKENYCPSCKLPRLLFPLTGVGARIPEDVNRQFCTLHPFIQKPGHDIYGNPFPVDQTGKTKKEREAIRKLDKLERQEKDNTPGSADTGNADGESLSGEASIKKLMAGGKGASYVPWHTCPQCKRSLLITKFAQHLEKCMGIGGRSARNAAAARLSGINGSQQGSQQGSRVGTPTPSVTNGKRDADDDDDDGPPKKKAKKEKKKEKAFEKKDDKEKKVMLKLKVSGKPEGNKPATSSALSASSKPGDKSRGDREGSAKRERDDTGGDTPKKKMKLNQEALPEIAAAAR
jgi:transcription regulator Sfg11